MPDAEFERDQQDWAALVKRVGFDNIPLNDEKWRPVLKEMWRIAHFHHLKVWTFDVPLYRDRLYQGMMGPPKRMRRVANDLQAALLKHYTLEELELAQPMMSMDYPMKLWFESVWTDKGTLRSRRH